MTSTDILITIISSVGFICIAVVRCVYWNSYYGYKKGKEK